jgi:hypothetical protein
LVQNRTVFTILSSNPPEPVLFPNGYTIVHRISLFSSSHFLISNPSQAHRHASNAEDALVKGLLIPAAEEHYKAAELFKACIEQATDEGVCQTRTFLKTINQLISHVFYSVKTQNKRTMRMLHDQHIKAGRELQRRIAKLREEKKDPSLPQIIPSVVPPATVRASPTPQQQQQHQQPQQQQPQQFQQQRKLTDSQYTFDESFMVLGGQRVRFRSSSTSHFSVLMKNCISSLIRGMLLINFGK